MPAKSRISSVPSQKSGTLMPTIDVGLGRRLRGARARGADDAADHADDRADRIESSVSSSVTGSASPTSVETGVPLM